MPELPQLEVHADAVHIAVRVQPRASRESISGVHDGALKVAVTAPPVEGEANAAVVALLARRFGVPKRNVEVLHGATGRSKVVAVRGVSLEHVRNVLADALRGGR